MTIINNCDHLLYLGGQDVETARYIAAKANKSITSVLQMPLESAWLFARSEAPRQVRKYDLKAHPLYSELSGGGRTGKEVPPLMEEFELPELDFM